VSLTALQGSCALVTFVTAGYPRSVDTVPICLAMQKGGVDIIELGVPFSDPIADGPAIQETNTVCQIYSYLVYCRIEVSRLRSIIPSIMPLCSVKSERRVSRVLPSRSCSWVSHCYPLQSIVFLNLVTCRLLQSHDRLWGRKGNSGCERSRRQWLYHGGPPA
jgi:hypothetical protein